MLLFCSSCCYKMSFLNHLKLLALIANATLQVKRHSSRIHQILNSDSLTECTFYWIRIQIQYVSKSSTVNRISPDLTYPWPISNYPTSLDFSRPVVTPLTHTHTYYHYGYCHYVDVYKVTKSPSSWWAHESSTKRPTGWDEQYIHSKQPACIWSQFTTTTHTYHV